MKSVDTQEKFIELRAKGLSYDKIAVELNVSKQTLISWSKSLSLEIANLKAIELETLYDQYYMTKQKRIELLGQKLKVLSDELDRRDITEIPTDKLYELIMKYTAMLKNDYSIVTFAEKRDAFLIDMSGTTETWTG